MRKKSGSPTANMVRVPSQPSAFDARSAARVLGRRALPPRESRRISGVRRAWAVDHRMALFAVGGRSDNRRATPAAKPAYVPTGARRPVETSAGKTPSRKVSPRFRRKKPRGPFVCSAMAKRAPSTATMPGASPVANAQRHPTVEQPAFERCVRAAVRARGGARGPHHRRERADGRAEREERASTRRRVSSNGATS